MSKLVWMIGDAIITGILDMEGRLPIRSLIPQATPEALARHADWLVPHFLDNKGYCILSTRVFVISSSGKKIIVDTGWGEHTIPGYEKFSGSKSLLDDLSGAGFPRESIDIVLCTHMHVDHVGRHTLLSGTRWIPTFPNARYIFVRKELEYWATSSNRLRSENFDEAVRPIVTAGLADLVDPDHQVTGEVRLEPTPGHTPGHVSVHIFLPKAMKG